MDEGGIANIISLRLLEKKYRVAYDSHANEGAFIVTTPDGDITFDRCPDTGFPYLDLDDHSNEGAVIVV